MLTLFRHYKGKDEKEAIYYLFLMKEHYPHRLEGMYEGMCYFESKDYDIAYLFGKAGFKAKKTGYLFLEQNINDYKFLFQFCMVAFYAGHPDEAADASDILKTRNMPESTRLRHEQNTVFYQRKSTKITKLNNPTLNNVCPNVVVIDNILKDPDSKRDFVLNQDFNVDGNYPGHRTRSFATQEDKDMFESILNVDIKYWPTKYNGSYQYTTKENKSWIHRDDGTNYSAILFLTPDPPVTGGTETFIHKELKNTFAKGDPEKKIMDEDSNKLDKWETLDSIGCLYNRLIVFNGHQSHKSRDFFGSSLKDGRLFQIFFFGI
jgi:hypothetical protein